MASEPEERAISDNSYEQYLKEGRLMGSTCTTCNALYVPPRTLCTDCHGTSLFWTEVSGRGRLVAFTMIAICPPAMIASGYGRDNPYCSGVVELDEGPRVAARIVGVDIQNPDAIVLGTLVNLCPAQEENTTLSFSAS